MEADMHLCCSEMGNAAGVPIEPPEQTAILDATLAIPGVLVAGVPGGTATSCIDVVLVSIVLSSDVLLMISSGWIRRHLCGSAS